MHLGSVSSLKVICPAMAGCARPVASVGGLRLRQGGMHRRCGHFAGHLTVAGSKEKTGQKPHRRSFLGVFADQQRNAEESSVQSARIGWETRKAKAQIDDRLFGYVQEHTREPEILRALRLETNWMQGSQMQVTPDQAQLLAMLVRLMGATQCIEVGVFNGYSSLAVALVLPNSGRLVACDRSEKSLSVAQEYFRRAGVSHKVDVRVGLAIDTLNELLLQGGAGRYDFAFIDADKRMYPQYYELLLQLVRPGGLVVVDNVLWHGTVADPLIVDSKTQSIRDFNDALLVDDRIHYTLVAIGDGMALCRKL